MTAKLPPLLVRVVALLIALSVGYLIGRPGEAPAPQDPDHADHAEDSEGDKEAEVWTCSMHPQIRMPGPGQCPICGMDLVPVKAGGEAEGAVHLSPRAQALAQLRTQRVSRAGEGDEASESLRLLGRVEVAESRQREVIAWFGGRVERLHVRVSGERVRAGQVVATLYSPEVYAAHQDLIAALAQAERLPQGSAGGAAEATLASARRRLELLGIPEAERLEMEAAESPTRTVALRSPYAGTVMERLVTEGEAIPAGAPVLRIADLSELWVQLDAYERELGRLRVGQEVTLTFEALPGESIEGEVAFIDPRLDPTRRTAEVRVAVKNPEGRLRPGLFAEAVVQVPAEDAPLLIPASAPLFTGRRSLVYVELPADKGAQYLPRVVELGPRLGEHYPVLSGLEEGERVVVQGAFVLDADLQLSGGASMLTMSLNEGPAPIALGEVGREGLSGVLEAYLRVQRALAADAMEEAQTAAGALGQAVDALELSAEAEDAWSPIAAALRGHAVHVQRAADLDGAREGFEPLSAAIEELLQRFENPLELTLSVASCPMAFDDRGARWVQAEGDIDNAYFGPSMLRCGELLQSAAPGGVLPAPPQAPTGGRAP